MNPTKILLVDDSKSARYALRLQLQRHETEVQTADSAEAALERVKADPPDAIFMDHTMPGMNGFEALEILKSSANTAAIPVVMCTSNEDPSYLAQARRKGALDVLAKSTAKNRLPTLLEEIRDIISGAAAPVPVEQLGAAPTREAADISHAIQSELDRAVGKRLEAILDERIQAALVPLMTDLSDRLTKDIETHVERRFGERLTADAQRLQHQVKAALDEQTRLSAGEPTDDSLRKAIAQHFEQERNNLAQLVQALIDSSIDSIAEEKAFMRPVLEMAEAAAVKAAEETSSRRAREVADEASLQQANAVADRLANATGSKAGLMYGLAALAALTGIGAAALVYLLLGG